MSRDKPLYWFATCPHTGRRLCQDMTWRHHTPIGDGPNCLRLWKRRRYAEKAATRHRIKADEPGRIETLCHVVALYDGDEIDAAGNIERANSCLQRP